MAYFIILVDQNRSYIRHMWNATFEPELKIEKIFLGVIFSSCVIYTKRIIHLGCGESDT